MRQPEEVGRHVTYSMTGLAQDAFGAVRVSVQTKDFDYCYGRRNGPGLWAGALRTHINSLTHVYRREYV